ncbi:bifunctional metallophosphatase/5'-nucleotidase [Ectobacillus panaciterrae]|uniref:bifunctional metallophosphatase/5'-nucleotidase n=1 Tax=Ectobacillus panaciterrae TaxID=363872 RepID=UPI00068469DE
MRRMIIPFLYSIVIAFYLSFPFFFTAAKLPQAQVHVHILSVNDFHGRLNTTATIHGKAAGRADYLAAYLKQRERTNPNTLLVHSGDMVGGSPPVSALAQDEPTIDFLNTVGFDVGTLGNHEFDKGIQEMLRLLYGGYHEKTGFFAGTSFPYVCANAVYADTHELLLPPYVIKQVDGIPIAFIGIVTTETPQVTLPENVASIQFLDEVETINHYTKELKAKGIHAIVVLAHNPGSTIGPVTMGDLARFAKETDADVDVLIGGHNHSYVNGTVNGKLLVEAYSYGLAFADIDLVIDRKTRDIVKKSAEIVPTYHENITPDPAIQQMLTKYETKTASITEKRIGTVNDTFTRDQDRNGQSSLGTLLADAQRKAMATSISFVNPGSIRADLQQGEVTWGALFTVQPFGHKLVKMNMTGKEIRDVLNEQWQDNDTNMLQVSGISYTWESTQPKGNRVGAILLEDGSPVEDARVYSVTINAFLAAGGDHFSTFVKGTDRVEESSDLEALVQYIPLLSDQTVYHATDRIHKTR